MTHYTEAQLAYLVQLLHPEKFLGAFPAIAEQGDDIAAIQKSFASLFRVDAETYRRIQSRHVDIAKAAAAELLKDSTFANRVDRLPFERGSTIVGLGDSITDDSQSWLEILRHVLAQRRPNDRITIVNAGISGDTTSQMVARFLGVVAQKPDWIICFAGTNDAKLQISAPSKTLVSLDETAANLDLLVRFAAKLIPTARWAWITPATVIPSLIVSHWFISPLQITWQNDDLRALSEMISRTRAGVSHVVDLQSLFGNPARPELLMDDGLHPSLAGQKIILAALVERLSSPALSS